VAGTYQANRNVIIDQLMKSFYQQPIWRWLRFALFSPVLLLLPAPRRRFIRVRRALGWSAGIALCDAEMLLKVWRVFGVTERVPQPLVSAVVCGGAPPLFFRYNTHDYYGIEQILADGVYDVLGSNANPRLIIDCGANIGATSRFFLQKYPHCRVISVEPGESNAEVCRRNVEGFGLRAQVLLAAVWGEESPLKIGRSPDQGIAGSMMEVRPAQSGEKPDMTAMRIDGILDRAGFARADVVKIDIEGAEADVFTSQPERFLDRTDVVVIELHGPSCEKSFNKALAGYAHQRETIGELVVCRGLRRLDA
jgi:FkbM family methyltransferase